MAISSLSRSVENKILNQVARNILWGAFFGGCFKTDYVFGKIGLDHTQVVFREVDKVKAYKERKIGEKEVVVKTIFEIASEILSGVAHGSVLYQVIWIVQERVLPNDSEIKEVIKEIAAAIENENFS